MGAVLGTCRNAVNRIKGRKNSTVTPATEEEITTESPRIRRSSATSHLDPMDDEPATEAKAPDELPTIRISSATSDELQESAPTASTKVISISDMIRARRSVAK